MRSKGEIKISCLGSTLLSYQGKYKPTENVYWLHTDMSVFKHSPFEKIIHCLRGLH